MNAAESRNIEAILPTSLYQAIERRAKVHGRSINTEIIALLAASLNTDLSEDLTDEITAWEAASDEDWLTMETLLAREAL